MILATYTTFLSLSSNPVAEIFLIITFLLFVYEAVIIVAIDVLFVEWVSLCLTWVLLVWIIVIGVVLVVRVLRICWWPLFFIVIVNIKFIFQLPRALQYWILFFNFQRISTTDVKVLFVSLVSYVFERHLLSIHDHEPWTVDIMNFDSWLVECFSSQSFY